MLIRKGFLNSAGGFNETVNFVLFFPDRSRCAVRKDHHNGWALTRLRLNFPNMMEGFGSSSLYKSKSVYFWEF